MKNFLLASRPLERPRRETESEQTPFYWGFLWCSPTSKIAHKRKDAWPHEDGISFAFL